MEVSVLGLVWVAAPLFLLMRLNARRNGWARYKVRRADNGGVRDIQLERVRPSIWVPIRCNSRRALDAGRPLRSSTSAGGKASARIKTRAGLGSREQGTSSKL